MKCETKTEAQRVAFFGMKKMQKAGTYALFTGEFSGKWIVEKEDGTAYSVLLTRTQGTCNCPFYHDNVDHAICKHIYWVREELAQYANFQSLCESAPANVLRGGI